jgi:hypothetical protein
MMTTNKEDKLCHEIHVDLPALAAGQLDVQARAAIERHLSFCPGCQFEWGQYELVWRCLGWSGDVEPPSDLRTRVLEAIQEHETKHGK